MTVEDRLRPGEPVRLSSRVRRLVAPNGGPMTGAGTNCYLLGEREIAVIDPGPAVDAHVDAIMAACGDRIHSIIVTHTHADHSPAAALLAARCGAPLVGAMPPDDAFQDRSFLPDMVLRDDQMLASDEWQLRAIHTPGHVGNHFCFLLEEEGLLMAGDHIMNGSTVVIIPPSGNMSHYIASLQRLLDYGVRKLAPGHGELMGRPREVIDWIIDHRLQREAKVVDRLQRAGRCTLKTLVVLVYDDVDPALHPMARLSLWAHLLKLEDEGRAVADAEYWQML